MKITFENKTARQRFYVPPALGNGQLSLMIDREGAMTQNDYCGMTPVIVRAGCRYDNASRQLIRFGYFEQFLPGEGKLTTFRQTLDPEKGCCTCRCKYESGLTVDTEVFCHLERNIIAVRKTFSAEVKQAYRIRYTLPRNPYLQIRRTDGNCLGWHSGIRSGVVCFYSPNHTVHAAGTGILEISGQDQTLEFFLAFDEQIKPSDNWKNLYRSHTEAWQNYWSDSSFAIPDDALRKMYMTAQYHLKISSTPWSVPTGIFPTHWEGRFFGYDEFFTHGALLTSGHIREAEKIVRFRSAGLESAIHRACFLKLCPEKNLAAHYPWETLEDGTEGGPEGFWLDRYVHMASIGLNCWEHWLFTRNRDLLKNVLYPVIRACAEYYRRSAVYTDSVTGPYIGKCTDMERLGEFVERPYSTTCGGIALFRAAVQCAEELKQDANLRKQWRFLAEKLHGSLPVKKGKYVPYPGCRAHSIAMYHGLFPFGVISPDDPKQFAAIRETEKNIGDFAGQYFHGTELTAWYAGLIASAEVRMGHSEKALQLLVHAADHSTGCFYECFEVYERKKLPWFTTASGAVVRAVNDLLFYLSARPEDPLHGAGYEFDSPWISLPAHRGTPYRIP